MPGSRHSRRLWTGIAGPSLFTVVWLVEGAIRPGYDPMRNWISELALTGRGWIQIANFLLSGLLIAIYGLALRDALRDGPGAVWGPRLVTVTGTSLALAGAFVIDPGTYRPPGIPAGPTWHGVLHDIFGVTVFIAAAMAVLVLSKRLTPWIGWVAAAVMLTLWVASGVAEGIDHAPAGLLQRLSILTGFGYLAWAARQIPMTEPRSVAGLKGSVSSADSLKERPQP